MIRFPVLRRLRVDHYQLFPGQGLSSPGIDLEFRKGPTLIAGVNGLGKSTLVAIMLRTLTGAVDIPGAAQDGDLGEVEPKPVPINPRLIFAPRVADGARDARSFLELSFGNRSMTIERRLSDLSLVIASVDQNAIGDEDAYRSHMTSLMGLGSFFDVLLVLRYVVFLLEDRRALVWGRTAQREILRALFIPPEIAAEISRLRYEMLSADSRFRNLRNVLNKRIRENTVEIGKVTSVSSVRAQLAVRNPELAAIRIEEEELEKGVAQEEAARQNARLRSAKAALDRDGATRELERTKVHMLRSKFKKLEDSGIYVLARLLSDDHCLVCDTQRAGIGSFVGDRLSHGNCPVCGTPKKADPSPHVADLTDERLLALQNQVRLGDEEVRSGEIEMRGADVARREFLERLNEVAKRKLNVSDVIRSLRARLPSSERTADDLETRNQELQKLIDEEELEYKQHRETFEKALKASQGTVAKSHAEVAKAFSGYANVFLKERCRIAFQPVQVQIGQTGAHFEVGLFQLSMSGGAVGGETPRTEPDQVSQSQREFLDLAFRMALIEVASGQAASTIVVDTPEASLDFLFAERAGNQLARFAKEGGSLGNRVIATTNLANPEIISAFLRGRPRGETAKSRVVDLLRITAPNAAVREDGAKYAKFLKRQITLAEAKH